MIKKILLVATLVLGFGLASKETKIVAPVKIEQPNQCCCRVGNGKIHCATVNGACSLKAVCYEDEAERTIPPTESDIKKENEYNSKFKM